MAPNPGEPLGPLTAGRAAEPDSVLPAARTAAQAAGVSRIADITRLDRLGLPVWQAVRPMSRALSVHQGKGRTAIEAQLGAMLEAVESDCAERFVGDGPSVAFDRLPAADRAASPKMFTYGGRMPLAAPARWSGMDELVRGGVLWVPEESLSLDLAAYKGTDYEQTSSGLASGVDREDAACAALRELVERDAMIEWRCAGIMAAVDAIIDIDTIGYRWWHAWRRRFAAQAIAIRLYHLPSVIDMPTVVCELNDLSRPGVAYRATHGSGCHADPEIALFRAVAEAIQSRATFIAGARDDLGADAFAAPNAGEAVVAFALPAPDGGKAWRAQPSRHAGLDPLVGALADAGFGKVGIREIGRPAGLSVVRAIVPGLGSLSRRRIAPVAG